MRVNEWDIYQAIGELPLDLIKTSSPKWPKRLGVGLSSAVALFLVAAIGFHTIFGYSGPIDKGDGPPMYLGPVTALGIAPTDAGAAELLKENISFIKKESALETDPNYSLQMEYHVKTNKIVNFILPENAGNAEVFVDGEPVSVTSTVNTAASLNRKQTAQIGQALRSIEIKPGYSDPYAGPQPDNTYELLTGALLENPSNRNITLDTTFQVYDISKAEVQKNNKFYFTIQGNYTQPRFLFTSGFYKLSDIQEKMLSEETKEIAYTLQTYSEDSAQTNWLAVPSDSPPLKVTVDGKNVNMQTKTFREILSQGLKIASKYHDVYVSDFQWYAAGTSTDGKIFVFDSGLQRHNYSYGINIYQFTVDRPGEHVIQVKTEAVGSDDNNTFYQIQWADSPKKLWAKAGPRKLTVDTGEGRYTYDIPDTVFDFYKEKEPAISSSK